MIVSIVTLATLLYIIHQSTLVFGSLINHFRRSCPGRVLSRTTNGWSAYFRLDSLLHSQLMASCVTSGGITRCSSLTPSTRRTLTLRQRSVLYLPGRCRRWLERCSRYNYLSTRSSTSWTISWTTSKRTWRSSRKISRQKVNFFKSILSLNYYSLITSGESIIFISGVPSKSDRTIKLCWDFFNFSRTRLLSPRMAAGLFLAT